MGEVFTYQTERPLQIFTKTASGVVNNRYFVTQAGAQCSVKGERAQGVAREYAADGATFAVTIEGTALVVAGEAFASAGLRVTTNALGKAILADATNYINGITMAAQSEIGQLVEIQLSPSRIAMAAGESDTTTTTTTTTTTA
jgi:hypothetical protein